jgi:hypothetical protein
MKKLTKNQKTLILGVLAIGLALYFFVLAPMLKRRKQAAQQPQTSAANLTNAGSATTTAKARNNTPRFPILWLDFNPNAATLQKQLNAYASRFAVKGAKIAPTKEDGFLGPDTLRMIRAWFPTIALDVERTSQLSDKQYGIIMSGPAVQPITAKTL